MLSDIPSIPTLTNYKYEPSYQSIEFRKPNCDHFVGKVRRAKYLASFDVQQTGLEERKLEKFLIV